jgi:MOSC domain-containing protein YiiM
VGTWINDDGDKKMALEMKQLRETMPQIGKVRWIGLRPARRAPLKVVQTVEASESGLEGDRFNGPPEAPRQVTLIQHEHISTIQSIMGQNCITPEQLRRNIVVSGINLQALRSSDFQIGDAILHATGNCAPCSLMEETLGPGGFNAMRGHGGITARVVKPGTIRVDDDVRKLSTGGKD